MISGDKPLISEVVLSQLVSEQDWGKTQMKASKNHNNVFR
jgi:flagellum-specific peptidoglycan hydrolase FlgJ